MLKYIPIIIAVSLILVGCEEEPIEIGYNPACPKNVAHQQGLKLLKAELRYPAGSKFPSFEENSPYRDRQKGECYFYWYFDADLQNGFGALRRSKISMSFHYDIDADKWIADSMLRI